LIELILVMAIFSTLIGITSLSLFNIQHRTALSADVSVFTADLKQQQLRAMVGEGDGTGVSGSDYGIHFESGRYTLFRGSYGIQNFVVNLSNNDKFLPVPSDIVFTKGNGQISSGVSVTIRDAQGNTQKIISINKYGVVTGVN
ncbi:MAG TPA: type II secretion system protein, partial [Candidatus Saccharimonadales bacterium]|nr:type II secretion system protein [Candidatus Saccharimonadales bacterium]